MEINFPNKGFPRPGEICPQGVKALAPGQAIKIDFREYLLPVQSLPPQKKTGPRNSKVLFSPAVPGSVL